MMPESQVLASKQEVLEEMDHFGGSRLQREVPLDSRYRETCKPQGQGKKAASTPCWGEMSQVQQMWEKLHP